MLFGQRSCNALPETTNPCRCAGDMEVGTFFRHHRICGCRRKGLSSQMNHRAITIHFASAKDIVCTFTHKANESVPKRSSLLAVTRCLSTVESKLEKDTPVWTFPREGLLWSDETSRVGNARSRPWLHKEKSQTRIYI